MNDNSHIHETRRGFTLIEMLLVMSIMLVLAAMVIPKLRVVTADRKIREAARVVESMFATARDDAMVNGFAGIEIVRNPNYTNGATKLFRMRILPPYAGDFVGDVASVSQNAMTLNFEFQLPVGASYPPPINDYAVNDFVQFNLRGPLYRISGAPVGGPYVLDVDLSYQVVPPLAVGVPFKIFRKSVRVVSSEVNLPRGQYIDLALSGFGIPALTGTDSVAVMYDTHGAIERFYPTYVTGGAASTGFLPPAPLFLLVASDEEANGIAPLDNISNLWITVNQTNGAVNTSEMGANTGSLDAARALATERLTAHQ